MCARARACVCAWRVCETDRACGPLIYTDCTRLRCSFVLYMVRGFVRNEQGVATTARPEIVVLPAGLGAAAELSSDDDGTIAADSDSPAQEFALVAAALW